MYSSYHVAESDRNNKITEYWQLLQSCLQNEFRNDSIAQLRWVEEYNTHIAPPPPQRPTISIDDLNKKIEHLQAVQALLQESQKLKNNCPKAVQELNQLMSSKLDNNPQLNAKEKKEARQSIVAIVPVARELNSMAKHLAQSPRSTLDQINDVTRLVKNTNTLVEKIPEKKLQGKDLKNFVGEAKKCNNEIKKGIKQRWEMSSEAMKQGGALVKAGTTMILAGALLNIAAVICDATVVGIPIGAGLHTMGVAFLGMGAMANSASLTIGIGSMTRTKSKDLGKIADAADRLLNSPEISKISDKLDHAKNVDKKIEYPKYVKDCDNNKYLTNEDTKRFRR
ncbi:MAG: hypothetical protein A3F12_03445 [Gammaproteobacteria bacterium RIFCSPHIGHO2_12_FULL_38_14]|nr:MAG: hypothetical protein A3F12_03445 [Gammaproteobacteria bacterium RIFCSPHIGHO2_12_FULL_38_14]